MLNELKHLILDMDGVLWRGETPMPGLLDFFATLRHLDINFVMATNNAAKTAEQYTERLARFGLQVPKEQILTSAEATADYLAKQYEDGSPAYVVGESGLQQAMRARGFHLITAAQVAAGETVPLVVAGFNRHVTYVDLAMGALLVHKGAAFVGTNPDPSYPSEIGPLPGAGALLSVIETATGMKPVVIGKPGPIIFQEALRRLGGRPTDTAMVGDRLSTDIAGGRAAGLRTILVLSGISGRQEAENGAIKPDYIFQDISVLAQALERSHDEPEVSRAMTVTSVPSDSDD